MLHEGLARDEVGLGHDGDDRHAPAPRHQLGQLRRDVAVAGTHLLVGGQAERDDVHLGQRVPHQIVQPLPQQRARPVQARRVHEHGLRVRPVHDPADRVPGGLGPCRHDRDLLPDERVRQGGLAGIGAAHQAGEPAPVLGGGGVAHEVTSFWSRF